MSLAMDKNEILNWLRETDAERLKNLWQRADETRRRHVGDAVHLRGLVEVSNYCARQCAYCGLRAGNRNLARYRMQADEIFEAAQQAVKFGYGTVVLQGGEDYGITEEWMSGVIRRSQPGSARAGRPWSGNSKKRRLSRSAAMTSSPMGEGICS